MHTPRQLAKERTFKRDCKIFKMLTDGMTTKEVAQQLVMTSTAVYVAMHRLRKTIVRICK